MNKPSGLDDVAKDLNDKTTGRTRTPEVLADGGRRSFIKRGLYGAALMSIGNPVLARSEQPGQGGLEFEIVRRNIAIPRLPEKLRGLNIAVVSDIHSGPFMEKSELDIYVHAVNSLDADVILLPGDFVQHRDEEIEPAAEAFQHLRAPYGVNGSTGNHDHYADVNFVCRELGNAGITMLRDKHTILDVKGERLALIGMDDDEGEADRSFHSRFSEAVEGLDRSLPNILLSHKPYNLDEASEKGVNLMISGHTHGGQVVLARLFDCVITPAALWSPYIEGLYRMDATQLYVTRGIGTVGVPLRWNCPAEITLLTLS